jgi:hypothetical protein
MSNVIARSAHGHFTPYKPIDYPQNVLPVIQGLKDKIQWATEMEAETIRNVRNLINRNKHKLNPDNNEAEKQAK